MIRHYFAYGSNMNPARMQARGLAFTERRYACLDNYRLVFNKRAHNKTGIAYANIAYAPGHSVEGFVYALERPQAIQLMDPFEGTPVRYSREVFSLRCGDDALEATETVSAWVYVANPAFVEQGLLPEAQYLSHLLSAADELSPAYVEAIRQQASVGESRAHCDESLRFNR